MTSQPTSQPQPQQNRQSKQSQSNSVFQLGGTGFTPKKLGGLGLTNEDDGEEGIDLSSLDITPRGGSKRLNNGPSPGLAPASPGALGLSLTSPTQQNNHLAVGGVPNSTGFTPLRGWDMPLNGGAFKFNNAKLWNIFNNIF